ncbi:HD domain-containing phosphohydrolase [Thermodesulfobacteriota bacterium]
MKSKDDQENILILDDEPAIRNMIERIVKKNWPNCTQASSAEEALEILEKGTYDLILSDINLPGKSGIDFISDVLSMYPDTAAIMVSGIDDPDIVEKTLEIGAYGYIVKPLRASEVIINISNALRRRKLEMDSRVHLEELEDIVQKRTAKLQEALDGIIQVVAQTVESRDPYTAGHQRRVAELALKISEEMKCPKDQEKGIHTVGVIHDLGKISIPAEILSKPTLLTDIEYSLMKTHPQIGYDILKEIDFPWPVAEIIYQHHERIDGTGYPRGLKGGEILLEAKIIAVSDVVEAMASHRPYRPALGIAAGLDEILKNKGKLYAPDVVDACLEVFRKGESIFE